MGAANAANSIREWFRPSRVLGLLLLAELLGLSVFIGWELCWSEMTLLGHLPPDLSGQVWITLIGGAAAMAGWIVSSIVTIRNSVKQHTVNTLLQSRLSAVYMENTANVNTYFFESNGEIRPIKESDLADDEESRKHIAAARYMLNYMEFVAVGIRQGDLNERLLRSSLRTILINVHDFSKVFIDQRRMKNSRIFENFLWLHDRWSKK